MDVVRHGSWELVRATPSPALREAVVGLCAYTERGAPVRRLETPGVRIVVILSLGPGIHVSGAGRCTSFVAGLHDAHTITEHDGVQDGLQLDLAPLAARRVFGRPLADLANRVVELEDVLGPRTGELLERLYEAAGPAAGVALVEAELRRRLADAPPTPAGVRAALGRVVATGGREPVGALAAELGWSRRHLGARVREELGLSPKTLARIVRFHAVTRRLEHEGGARLAEIALDCGFYDQAHLNRDFRAFAGTTPGDYVARLLPGGGGVAASDPVAAAA